MTDTAQKLVLESNGATLLADDQDFLILKAAGYGDNYNITCRSPRMIGGTLVPLICTSTIDVSRLNGLRVETMDEKYFIVNDSRDDAIGRDRGIRINVVSEEVGHQIVKALVEITSGRQPASDEAIQHLKDVPEAVKKANTIATSFAPLICLSFLCLLALSASHWLITH